MEIRSAISPRKRVTLECPEDSGKTVQYFKEICDVNNIVAKHGTNGGPIWANQQNKEFLDCTNLPDFQEAHAAVTAANQAFMSLPAKIRQNFDNDPHKFVMFATDENNLEQLRALGLARPVEVLESDEGAQKTTTEA